MKGLFNVISFSYWQIIKKKSFLIITGIMLLFVCAMGFLPNIIGTFANIGESFASESAITETDASGNTVSYSGMSAVNDSTGIVPPEALNGIGGYKWVADRGDLRAKVESGEYKSAINVYYNADGIPEFEYIVEQSSMYSDTTSSIGTTIKYLYNQQLYADNNISQETIRKLEAGVNHTLIELAGKNVQSVFVPVYIMMFFLYITIISYSALIITSVVYEKSSRVMEILITSARPVTLMVGKVIGVGFAGLTQFALLLSVGAIMLTVGGGMNLGPFSLDFSVIPPDVYVYFVLFFLFGYFMYSSLNAAAGSMVSKVEESNMVAMPVMLLIVVTFMISMMSLGDPSNPIAFVASFIPLCAPMVMLLRIAATDVPFYQIAISIVSQIVTIGLILWLAAKIYRVGVLLYGKVPSLGELVRAIKNYKV